MDKKSNQPRVKPIFAYFKDSMKFYDMDNPMISQIVFILQLAVIFGGYIFARPYTQEFFIYFEQFNNKLQGQLGSKTLDISLISSDIYMNMMDSLLNIILILLVIKSISFIVSLYYGAYYFYSQTHPAMTGAQRTFAFLQRLPKIILFNILFYGAFYFGAFLLLLAAGFIMLVMPVFSVLLMALPLVMLIINTVFVFKDFLIIEFDTKILRNFKKALDLTKGCRKNVIINSLWPLCIGWLVSVFAVDVQNPILSLFIASFIEVIVLLISQRLTALMFIDAASMERHVKKPVQNIKNS